MSEGNTVHLYPRRMRQSAKFLQESAHVQPNEKYHLSNAPILERLLFKLGTLGEARVSLTPLGFNLCHGGNQFPTHRARNDR